MMTERLYRYRYPTVLNGFTSFSYPTCEALERNWRSDGGVLEESTDGRKWVAVGVRTEEKTE